MQNTVTKGRIAEIFVVSYLQKLSYKIIAQNYHSRYGELDIITSYKNELIIVEVKSLAYETHYAIEQLITRQKLYKMRLTLYQWLKNNPEYIYFKIRFDYIGIVINHTDQQVSRIKHLKNIGIFQ